LNCLVEVMVAQQGSGNNLTMSSILQANCALLFVIHIECLTYMADMNSGSKMLVNHMQWPTSMLVECD